MLEHRILKDTTPTILSYPRLRPNQLAQAKPTGSPTVFVTTPASSSPVSTPATIDAVSTTVTAPSLAGERELAVVSATFIRGRRYLVTFEGNTIVVEARSGGTGTTLRLVDALPCDVPDDAVVEGFAVTRALTLTETRDVGEAAALWSATIEGVVSQWSSLYRIVSRMPTALLTEGDLVRAYPVIKSMMPAGDLSLDTVIGAAWDTHVIPLLEAKKVFDEDVISDVTLVPLHALACMRLLYDFDARVSDTFRADIKAAWDESIATTFARVTYAERMQDDEDPITPRRPGAEAERGRMRMRP
jgi:hypothetical protein